jgi:hypothetical protein
MGMGMLLSGISAAGNSAAGVARDYQRDTDAELAAQRQAERAAAMERLRTDMNVEQAARIAENQRTAAEAPARSFSALVKKYAGEEQSVIPDAVTELSGAGTDSGLPGLHGDVEKMRSQIMAIQDPEIRALGLKQLDQQLAADEMTAAKAAEGMTTRRTPEEATAAALSDAKMNDPTAYMAGKAMNQDKYLQVTAGGAVIDTTSGKVIFNNSAMMDKAKLDAETKLAVAEARNASAEEIATLRAEAKAAAGGAGKTPAIVATANWLVEQGIAKTPAEAWHKAKQSASRAESDNVVKIAGILSSQPGYKPTSKTGKGGAADLFADAAALADGIGAADAPPAAAPAPRASQTPYPLTGLPQGAVLQPQFAPRKVYKLPNGDMVEQHY